MRRREFCCKFAMFGGAVLLGPLVKGCAPHSNPAEMTGDVTRMQIPPTATNLPRETGLPMATATTAVEPDATEELPAAPAANAGPQASPTSDGPVATIALVKTADRAYGARRAIELLGLNPIRGNRVLLKPNYNSADPAPASTHPEILRSLVLQLNDMGARHVTVGERSGMGNTRSVLDQTGVFQLADELGFDTVVFDELDEADWAIRQSGDFHWEAGFAVPKLLLDSQCVVQTCNLKTHRFGGHFTMSLKNSVGFVARTVRAGGYNYMEELHRSPYQRQMIAEINAVYEPALILMDGVEAFVDGGPASGKKFSPLVVIAGTDRVAIDAVGVAILRLFGTTPQVSQGSVFEQEQIMRAVELGQGIDAPQRINIVTGDTESESYAEMISRFLL